MPKIEMYSKTNCSYCAHARNFFKDNNISFSEYKLDTDFTREELTEKFPQAVTYPVIVINDKFIGGFVDLKEWYRNETYLYEGEWNGA